MELRAVVSESFPLGGQGRQASPARDIPQIWAAVALWGALWTVAFSRWGSYIGISSANIYVPDVLTIAGILGVYVTRPRIHRPKARTSVLIPALAGILVTYAVLQIALRDNSLYSEIRDAAPFFYLALVPALAHMLTIIGSKRANEFLRIACWIHLAWALPSSTGLIQPSQVLPGVIAPELQFAIRGDVDAITFAVSLVIATIGLGRRTASRRSDFVLAAGAVVGLLSQQSRAGVVALGVTMLALGVLYKPWRDHLGKVLLALWLAITCTTTLVVLDDAAPSFLASSDVVARLGLASGSDSDQLRRDADATVNARKQAWTVLWDYTNNSTARKLVGSGPGSDMMSSSGAVQYLSGDIRVRAPHNWPLGAYSRFGALGFVLWLLLVVVVVPGRPKITDRPFVATCPYPVQAAPWVAIAVGFGFAACVGVVMESPFGALAFSVGLAGWRTFSSSALECAIPALLTPRPTARGRALKQQHQRLTSHQ